MAYHSWKRLDWFPKVFSIVFVVGIFLPSIVALINCKVTPFVPYISEGGGHFPEAGIFSLCIVLSSFLSQGIILFCYLVTEEKCVKNDMDVFLNKISLALGSLATFALTVVASFPTTSISEVHNAAAGAACVCLVIYMVCRAWISKRTEAVKISYIRITVATASAITLLLVAVFGVLGSSQWTANRWPGSKTPQDEGFLFYVLSASAEWVLAILYLVFFLTYISDFKKSTFHFHLEMTDRNKRTVSVVEVKST